MGKPNPLQVETLKAIADGKVRMINCGTAAFRIFGGSPGCVGHLVRTKGWARWPKPIGEQTCELTDIGKAILEHAIWREARGLHLDRTRTRRS
jgi:hypothetical protein